MSRPRGATASHVNQPKPRRNGLRHRDVDLRGHRNIGFHVHRRDGISIGPRRHDAVAAPAGADSCQAGQSAYSEKSQRKPARCPPPETKAQQQRTGQRQTWRHPVPPATRQAHRTRIAARLGSVKEAYAPRHHLIRGQRVGLKRYHTDAEGHLDPGRRSRSAAIDANSSGVAIHRGQREGAGTLSTGTTGRHGHVSGSDGEVRRGGQRRRIGVSQVECKKESENGEQTVSLHGRNLPAGGLHPACTVRRRLTQGAAMFCRNFTRA